MAACAAAKLHEMFRKNKATAHVWFYGGAGVFQYIEFGTYETIPNKLLRRSPNHAPHVVTCFIFVRMVWSFREKTVATQKTRNIRKFGSQMGPGVPEPKKNKKYRF